MSSAATHSHRGDDYQLLIALHWLIRLLRSEEGIEFLQVESNGLPGQAQAVVIDDVVVVYPDLKLYITIKKNHPNSGTWRISDPIMREELKKALQQLEGEEQAHVMFYSSSPFGEFDKLSKNLKLYPDIISFERDAPETTLKTTFNQLCSLWDRQPAQVYNLASRLEYALPRDFEEWQRANLDALNPLVPRAKDALPILEKMLGDHQSKRGDFKHKIVRQDVLDKLAQAGIFPTPLWDEEESLTLFARASKIGRDWQRGIDGHKFTRLAVAELLNAIQKKHRLVLLKDGPGTGKTCVLLDLMEQLEQTSGMASLFIRGDFFEAARTEQDLSNQGLPDAITGRCARLAENRQVVLVVDSLDVLSLQRDHGALKLFLRLMDQWAAISGVTVIAACRTFDLEYHTHLRDRKWDHIVPLGTLDWQTEVEPILRGWNLTPETLSPELTNLLLIPQNLRLFHKIAHVAAVSSIRSAYQLHNLFLEHLVLDDKNLGKKALKALQKMAHDMMVQREKKFSVAAWGGTREVMHGLISKGILYDSGDETISFTHQTLRDNLLVRLSVAKGKDLAEFVHSLPPLPFVRPTIRSYVLHLATIRPNSLGKQVYKVLCNSQVPYHIRRLIAETLAEIQPREEDFSWIHRLFQEQPEIFWHMFYKTTNDAWFHLLHDQWLPSVEQHPELDNWRQRFFFRLNVWMNCFPVQCLALWRAALEKEKAGRKEISRILSTNLENFTHWSVPGIRSLLEDLIKLEASEFPNIGRVLSRYVKATNQGDDLLWYFICLPVNNDDAEFYHSIKLYCDQHYFHDNSFLKNRFIESEILLNFAISTIEKWANILDTSNGERWLVSDFIKKTSWRLRHEKHDYFTMEGFYFLFDVLENAINYHIDNCTQWWNDYEHQLRKCRSLALRYLLLRAYIRQPDRNADGISYQLLDNELYDSYISFSIGELINACAPYVEKRVIEYYQQKVINDFDKEDEDRKKLHFVKSDFCGKLSWVPCIYRTQQAQTFIDQNTTIFGTPLPTPQIFSWSGDICPPISSEDLNAFSDSNLIKLLRYYDVCEPGRDFFTDSLIGGKNSVNNVLRVAASNNPLRYLAILKKGSLDKEYIESIANGVCEHLRNRLNKNSPNNSDSVESLPSTEFLLHTLLELLEWHPEWLLRGWTGVHILEVCAKVFMKQEDVERLTDFFTVAIHNPNPAKESEGEAINLINRSINSARGVLANSASQLTSRLLEAGLPLPTGLISILEFLAKDPISATRVGVLHYTPMLIYHNPSLGRRLFVTIFEKKQGAMWNEAYNVLYYNYYKNFTWVEPYLIRMFFEIPDESAHLWAQIATLCMLAGQITFENLFESLKSKNNEKAWEGAIRVFKNNFEGHESRALCQRGLDEVFHLNLKTEDLFPLLQRVFHNKKCHPYIKTSWGFRFINYINFNKTYCNMADFFSWLAFLAEHDPQTTIEISEQLVIKLATRDHNQIIFRTENLFTAMTTLFRAADETEDEQLLRRVVALQDQFLKLGMKDIEKYLEKAESL